MKKLIALTALFLAFGLNSTQAIAKQQAMQECLQRAWDYGTMFGMGDPALEYAATNRYATEVCGV